ncbi:MAG: hypothetical protein AAFY76_08445 [Cyanobacteria bacterium J06649_11]
MKLSYFLPELKRYYFLTTHINIGLSLTTVIHHKDNCPGDILDLPPWWYKRWQLLQSAARLLLELLDGFLSQ